MQLVPLSTDGRVTVVVTAPLPPGPLRVALRPDGGNVVIETLGPAGARPIGRFALTDAAAYRPVLARLAARGQVGTCPARMIHSGEVATLILHLGSPSTCAPRDVRGAPASLAVARTTRLRAAVPTMCAARPQQRTGTLPRPRMATSASTSVTPTHPVPPPARPLTRFGQPEDQAPRLTRPQRRRVLWATLAVAASLLLACVLQPDAPTEPVDGAVACNSGGGSCAR